MFLFNFLKRVRPLASEDRAASVLQPAGLGQTLALSVLFIVVLATTYGWQSQQITVPADVFFVFVIGQLLIGAYLFFARVARPAYYVPIHLFLCMFAAYGNGNGVDGSMSGLSYGFYLFAAAFLFVSLIYVWRTALPQWVKWGYSLAALAVIVAAFAWNPVLLFMLCSLYLIVMLQQAQGEAVQKWHVLTVGMLHVLAILVCAAPLTFSYQSNTLFTLPLSFLCFVIYLNFPSLRRAAHRLLFVEGVIFTGITLLLAGYAVASFRQLYLDDSNILALFIPASLLLIGGTIALSLAIRQQLAIKQHLIEMTMNDWFVHKWEDALGQQGKQLSWTGFDTKLAILLPNDGVRLLLKQDMMYESGCFAASAQGACNGGKRFAVGEVELELHETNVHQPFTLAHYYTAYAMAGYLARKLSEWREVSKLAWLVEEQAMQDGNFGRELRFRKEVTYYLHDNILQNIIATKNIIDALQADQPALKELAVETLAEMNESIRSQMHDIYPSTLADLSFERNIHILLAQMRRRYGAIPHPHIRYEIHEQLDEQTAYVLYRTLQELLNNTCKYAEATHIWIHLYAASGWIMEVREDGKPLDPEEMTGKIKHLGISSLRQQASALGGIFQWEQHEHEKRFLLTLPRRSKEKP